VEGLTALEDLAVAECFDIHPDNWLPACSAAKLRALNAYCCCGMHRLPDGLCALEELEVTGCRALAEDWLPACSAARLRALHARHYTLTQLPRGLHALEELNVQACRALLAEDWLPSCSAARLRTLNIDYCRLTRLPPGLHALAQLSCRDCTELEAAYRSILSPQMMGALLKQVLV
jgi:hypothetical protein